jgi:hypothetical protein
MMCVGTGGVAPALELLPSIGNICLAAVFYKQLISGSKRTMEGEIWQETSAN